MPHLALGLLIMLVGALVMALGLYIRTTGPSSVARERTVANVVSSAVVLLLGLIIAIAGIIVSLEPNTTAPR
jgi:hypothetical protein